MCGGLRSDAASAAATQAAADAAGIQSMHQSSVLIHLVFGLLMPESHVSSTPDLHGRGS